jgi:hypothetical protein
MGIVLGGYAAMPLVRPAPENIPVPDGENFDADAIVSLDLLREHTKTEDVLSVTDNQLRLYRAAAIEAAALHTGHLFNKSERVTETIRLPRNYSHGARSVKHRTRYPVAAPQVYLMGPGIQGNQALAIVDVGSRDLRLPNVFFAADFSNCCGGCSVPGGELFQIMYLAGFVSPAYIPRGIVTGILKYVAWLVAHPGDRFVSVNDQERVAGGSLSGSSSTLVASGALEDWRQYVNEA